MEVSSGSRKSRILLELVEGQLFQSHQTGEKQEADEGKQFESRGSKIRDFFLNNINSSGKWE